MVGRLPCATDMSGTTSSIEARDAHLMPIYLNPAHSVSKYRNLQAIKSTLYLEPCKNEDKRKDRLLTNKRYKEGLMCYIHKYLINLGIRYQLGITWPPRHSDGAAAAPMNYLGCSALLY